MTKEQTRDPFARAIGFVRLHARRDPLFAKGPDKARIIEARDIVAAIDADTPADSVAMVRITRGQYPEIIQAARWMDEDNGTDHFEPGTGFIVDDPDGLTVPTRWIVHLPTIEAALAGLDHERPHPEDVDTLEWLAREGREPSLYESAVYCFVSGEHTPMTAIANSSRELWIASRFFNERFEGWTFDPAADFPAPAAHRVPRRDWAWAIFDWVEARSHPSIATAWTCGLAATTLAWMLRLVRLSPVVMADTIRGVGHMWVEMDGRYYDPTIGQFGEFPGTGMLPHPLSATPTPVGATDGHVLVPAVATREMVDAADACTDAYSAYAAMVEVARVR